MKIDKRVEENKLSRRDFLGISGLAVGTTMVNAWQLPAFILGEFPERKTWKNRSWYG